MIGHRLVAVFVWEWEMSVESSGEGRMNRHNMTPNNTEIVFLCFEGPDPYAMAGGLGTRVDHLSRTLAVRMCSASWSTRLACKAS
jgi:hypothetical protein